MKIIKTYATILTRVSTANVSSRMLRSTQKAELGKIAPINGKSMGKHTSERMKTVRTLLATADFTNFSPQ